MVPLWPATRRNPLGQGAAAETKAGHMRGRQATRPVGEGERPVPQGRQPSVPEGPGQGADQEGLGAIAPAHVFKVRELGPPGGRGK